MLALLAFCGLAVAGCHTTPPGKPLGKRTVAAPAAKPQDFFDRYAIKPASRSGSKPTDRHDTSARAAVSNNVVTKQDIAVPPATQSSGFHLFARKPVSPAGSIGKADTPVKPVPSDVLPQPPPVVEPKGIPSSRDEAVKLRPGLVLNVTVLVSGKKEIEEPGRRISDNSMITLPLLGAVKIKEDDTLDTLSLHLVELYREYFVNPQAIVDFMRDDNREGLSPWGNVTVLGRVKKPGRIAIPATRDLTVSAAIQQAGGFDTSAKDTAIRITHRKDSGAVTTREINLRAVGSKGQIEEDVILEPDDVVFVPELMF